jgi:hypothetical protein
MTPEQLFLRRHEQIAVLSLSESEGDFLDLAARIRQMLFDSTSLVDTVNTNKIRLEFLVGVKTKFPPGVPQPHIHMLGRAIDPVGTPIVGRSTLTRAQFGQHVIGKIDRQVVTVKTVVTFMANVEGGVHHDPRPTKLEHKAAKLLSEAVSMNGMSLLLTQIRPIATVTLRALQPLVEDVQKRS